MTRRNDRYQAMHGPIEAPQHYIDDPSCAKVSSLNKRKVYCGMMVALDEGNRNTQTNKHTTWSCVIVVVVSAVLCLAPFHARARSLSCGTCNACADVCMRLLSFAILVSRVVFHAHTRTRARARAHPCTHHTPKGIANVTKAYQNLGIWNDTVTILCTDNGGQYKLF